MSFYRHHLFFCTNRREDGSACCQDFGAQAMRDYVKDRIKQLNQGQADQIRVNSAGCLGRCDQGPTLVIYPAGLWYTYVDRADLDEIIDQVLHDGPPVQRLLIQPQ